MKIKTLSRRLASVFATLALTVGVVSTSATCRFILHQTEVPEKMKNLISK